MATFVLVHGAMHGAWCWRPVEERLRAAGHRCHAPTLAGCGDRAHLLTRETSPTTHVDDLLAALFMEDLSEVVLVLHSYSGVLAGPVVERAGGRIARVVGAGAFLADPGQSAADMEPAEVMTRYRHLVDTQGDGWRVPASPGFVHQWGVPPDLEQFVGERLTDFPARCVTDAVHFDPAPLAALPGDYVVHTAPAMQSLEASATMARARGWRMHEIHTGHDMMLVDPDATARLLMEIASR